MDVDYVPFALWMTVRPRSKERVLSVILISEDPNRIKTLVLRITRRYACLLYACGHSLFLRFSAAVNLNLFKTVV